MSTAFESLSARLPPSALVAFSPAFTLRRIDRSIFLVTMPDRHDLAFAFLRAQEHHESVNPEFQGRGWLMADYERWYAQTQSKDGSFSYGDDWSGFNVPSSSIESCYSMTTERLATDQWFLNVALLCQTRARQAGLRSYYLIGAHESDAATLDHEIAHGLFHTDESWRSFCLDQIERIPASLRQTAFDQLRALGYADSVHVDELQAFISTGLNPDRIPCSPQLAAFEAPFIEAFQARKLAQGSFDVLVDSRPSRTARHSVSS